MDGSLLIGGRAVATDRSFRAYDPTLQKEIGPEIAIADERHVAEACAAADASFDEFRSLPPTDRAAFLEAIAAEVEMDRQSILRRAFEETALPASRLEPEFARTVGQLRMFANLLRIGRWAGVVIERSLPDRQPLRRPDLRQRRIGIGPVAVFGSSNFPLAFSVAGGDTASAFAAGCPIVVKGHPAHPGTSQIVAGAIMRAIDRCGIPQGVFSLVQGPSNSLGAAVVRDPNIKAVAFTGSRAGGLALLDLANGRPEPIPVYAEMSSVNPVILLPTALADDAEQIARGYVASLTLAAGQLCTNPGIVIGIDGPDLDRFIVAAGVALSAAEPQVMLSPGIRSAFEKGVAALQSAGEVEVVARGVEDTAGERGRSALFTARAKSLIHNPKLGHEIFGAASLVVRADNVSEVVEVIDGLEGQLALTLHLRQADAADARLLLPRLERKAGRILVNGWPTGIEVSRAIVHGGPFPATSDSRSTSVGAAAIERFLRPICYQDMPDWLLPDEVREENPLNLPRWLEDA